LKPVRLAGLVLLDQSASVTGSERQMGMYLNDQSVTVVREPRCSNGRP
jgi:hypothetical protein